MVIEPHYCHGTREIAYASQDPKEELLLGPAYAIPKVCHFPGSGSTMNFHHAGYGEGRNGTRRLPGDHQQNLFTRSYSIKFSVVQHPHFEGVGVARGIRGPCAVQLEGLGKRKVLQGEAWTQPEGAESCCRRTQESVQSITVPDLGGVASHGEAQQLGRLRIHWTSFWSYRWMLDLKRPSLT